MVRERWQAQIVRDRCYAQVAKDRWQAEMVKDRQNHIFWQKAEAKPIILRHSLWQKLQTQRLTKYTTTPTTGTHTTYYQAWIPADIRLGNNPSHGGTHSSLSERFFGQKKQTTNKRQTKHDNCEYKTLAFHKKIQCGKLSMHSFDLNENILTCFEK